MINIWGFFTQTLTVSLVAAVLLFLKQLLYDKLSARFQYWLWGLLALRMILPVSLGKQYLFIPLYLWIETAKGRIEALIESAYTAVYMPIIVKHPLPQLISAPSSITDWLFILYTIGVLLFFLRFLYTYIRLSIQKRKGTPLTLEAQTMLDDVCQKYKLKSCRAVSVSALSSPVICGVFRPILLLPKESDLDEKMLLHAMLHVKYHDALQTMLFGALFTLHWCNPLLIYISRRIKNDMEALCDLRVLELLEKDDRQTYEDSVSSMSNASYPCLPDSSYRVNREKQINRRIATIAHFKRYPQNTNILTICIMLVLIQPILIGARNDKALSPHIYSFADWNFAKVMAAARTTRCTTMAGALDTYAKGLMFDRGIYIAAASPLSKHEELAENMQLQSERREGILYGHSLDGGITDLMVEDGYAVYDLEEQEDGSYKALLAFFCDTERIPKDDMEFLVKFDWDMGYYAVPPYNGPGELLVVPVTVRHEDAWVVTPNGERQVYKVPEHRLITQYGDLVPSLGKTYQAVNTYGTVQLTTQHVCMVDNTLQPKSQNVFQASNGYDIKLYDDFDSTPKPTAEFFLNTMKVQERYSIDLEHTKEPPKNAVTVLIAPRYGPSYQYDTFDEKPYFTSSPYDKFIGCDLDKDWKPSELKERHNSDGGSWARYALPLDQSWDGTMAWNGFIRLGDWYASGHPIKGRTEGPVDFAARIYWDDMVKATFILEEVHEDA